MIHLGDITKINGAEIPVVDVITGGSPCQDLSVAGKRAGLQGERSGLFMEQIRIIKEMREHDRLSGRTDEHIRCRWMVWENVPGALSSGTPKGEDFRIVLEETARVAQPDAVIPRPERGGWKKSGCVMGDRWSIAWRIHDAQFWGVPQRRKRISLVADFGGQSAPEVLFERKGMSRDSEKSCQTGQTTAGTAESCHGRAIGFNRERDGAVTILEKIPTLQAAAGESGNNQPMVYCLQGAGEITATLRSQSQGHEPIVIEMTSTKNTIVEDGISPTLTARMGTGGNQVNSVYCLDVGMFTCHENIAPTELQRQYKDPPITYQQKTGSLLASGYQKNGTQEACNDMYIVGNKVRKLTPLECERLQGYPDEWTDIGEWIDSKGKKRQTTDSARYKALGNSIALPFWKALARRIAAQYDRDITMGSLFDGIGGFPLAFEHAGAKAVWASEIEEFCIAVTRERFKEE